MRAVVICLLGCASILALGATGRAVASELPDHPLSLEECISLGMQLNPSLVVARESVIGAEANLKRSLASYYPSASLVVVQGRTGGTSFVETAAGTIAFSTDDRRRESQAVLQQTIWQTGRRESTHQSRHAAQASRSDAEAARQGLIWSVSQLYYQALAAEDLVAVGNASLAASRDHEKLVRARAEVGEAAPVDLLPAAANSAETEFSLLQTENAADLAKARLKNAIGLPPTYSLRLARPEPGEEDGSIPPFEEALELALGNRPEMASLRESLAAAEQGVRQAEATKNMALSVSAQYERGIKGPREGESWSVVAYATAFLFDGGLRKANVDAARSSLRSLKAYEQQLSNSIGLEVETALLDVGTARKSLDASEKTLASAEAQLAGAEGKYREGVGIFVEILDAQEVATRARANRVRAMYDYQTALLALEKAIGALDGCGEIL